MSSLFHTGCQWRGVAEVRRWTATHTRRFTSKNQEMLHGWVHTILCISLLLGTACATEKNLAKPEMEKLQGTWQLVYQQINGKKLPDEKTAEMLHGKMVFTGNKIHYTVELQGFDFEFTYRLHPDQE